MKVDLSGLRYGPYFEGFACQLLSYPRESWSAITVSRFRLAERSGQRAPLSERRPSSVAATAEGGRSAVVEIPDLHSTIVAKTNSCSAMRGDRSVLGWLVTIVVFLASRRKLVVTLVAYVVVFQAGRMTCR